MSPIDRLNGLYVHLRLLTERFLTTEARDERGNVTTEHVMWAAVVVALVGTVAAVLISFVNGQLALIR